MEKFIGFRGLAESRDSCISTLYREISRGYLPPTLSITGGQKRGWPQSEIEAINTALIAGASPDEIRALVKRITEDRKKPRPSAARAEAQASGAP